MKSSNESSARFETTAKATGQRGRPRRQVVARTPYDATPALCESSASIIASDTQNKRAPKRKQQVVSETASTGETEIVDRELARDNFPKRNKLEPAPSSLSATSQFSAALSSEAPLRVTPLPPLRPSTSGQSIPHFSLACNSTSKSETAYKPPVEVRARSRPSDVLAALRGSPLPDLRVTSTSGDVARHSQLTQENSFKTKSGGTASPSLLTQKNNTAAHPFRTAPRPATPSTATSSNFRFASGVGAGLTSSTTTAVAQRTGVQQVGNQPGLQQKQRFATKHLAEYVQKNASREVDVMNMKKAAEELGDRHLNVSFEQHDTDSMKVQPQNTEEADMRRVDNLQLNHNIKCDVVDEDIVVIDERLATGITSTHYVNPVADQVKQQYSRRSYPFTQSSHQLMPHLGYHPEVQHENKPARSSLITNFSQKMSEVPTSEKVYLTQEDLMDVKLGKIETQPLQAVKFNCPFDIPRVNYFKVKNISEHRIGIMINVSSCDRIDLDTQLVCLSPLDSVTIKVTTRVFDLMEYTKDYIAIEWMNVLDTTVLTNEWFCGDGPRNKKTLTVEYSL